MQHANRVAICTGLIQVRFCGFNRLNYGGVHVKIDMKGYFQTIKCTMLCAGLAIGVVGQVSTAIAAVGGTPAYQVESVPFQWVDATTGIKQPTRTAIPIGFDFGFYGEAFNSLAILESGVIVLGSDPNAVLASRIKVFQDSSLVLYYPSSAIYTRLEGTAPNRRLTISWVDMAYFSQYYCPSDTCIDPLVESYYGKGTFQTTLHEGSNDIVFRYQDVVFTDGPGTAIFNPDYGATAAVEIQNRERTQGVLYSRQSPNIFNASALRFFMSTPANLSPITDAGADQILYEGETIVLRDNGSRDPDGNIAGYQWNNCGLGFESPCYAPSSYWDTATISLTAPTVDADRVLSFSLTTTDNRGAYTTDSLQVTVRNVTTTPPIVNAGPDITANASAVFTLTGSATDSDGAIIKYLWEQVGWGIPVIVACTGKNTAILTCTAPATPTVPLTFQLTVTDNGGAVVSDTAVVTVITPPVANAGWDQIVKQKTTVTLDGSNSYGTGGSVAGYQWRQVSGKTVTLDNATSAKPTFVAPSTDKSTKLTFELTVTDKSGATAKDQVVVTVTKR